MKKHPVYNAKLWARVASPRPTIDFDKLRMVGEALSVQTKPEKLFSHQKKTVSLLELFRYIFRDIIGW